MPTLLPWLFMRCFLPCGMVRHHSPGSRGPRRRSHLPARGQGTGRGAGNGSGNDSGPRAAGASLGPQSGVAVLGHRSSLQLFFLVTQLPASAKGSIDVDQVESDVARGDRQLVLLLDLRGFQIKNSC